MRLDHLLSKETTGIVILFSFESLITLFICTLKTTYEVKKDKLECLHSIATLVATLSELDANLRI